MGADDEAQGECVVVAYATLETELKEDARMYVPFVLCLSVLYQPKESEKQEENRLFHRHKYRLIGGLFKGGLLTIYPGRVDATRAAKRPR